ncbi:hypothetical protein COMA1_20401 [Candidatus Nitrospira nitrosa]|uniref:Uncharacterized protein n=1 Tax=Candidatus Nitrospira nitrosa TaxID=1742972 RepID=A0A0S4LDG4_9BACT|nr:hypothetical protein COMA1_20401 [Candidatus Nitrospira nitrosa]
MLRRQSGREADVFGNRWGNEPLEVFLIQTGEEILKNIGWYIRAERTDRVEKCDAVWCAGWHGRQYT